MVQEAKRLPNRQAQYLESVLQEHVRRPRRTALQNSPQQLRNCVGTLFFLFSSPICLLLDPASAAIGACRNSPGLSSTPAAISPGAETRIRNSASRVAATEIVATGRPCVVHAVDEPKTTVASAARQGYVTVTIRVTIVSIDRSQSSEITWPLILDHPILETPEFEALPINEPSDLACPLPEAILIYRTAVMRSA